MELGVTSVTSVELLDDNGANEAVGCTGDGALFAHDVLQREPLCSSGPVGAPAAATVLRWSSFSGRLLVARGDRVCLTMRHPDGE